MKKALYLALCIFAAFFAPSCQTIEEQETSRLILTAIMDGEPISRTSLSAPNNGKSGVLWSEGDEIGVYLDDAIKHSSFTLISGAGTKQASFSGEGFGSSFLAVYPAGLASSRSGSTLHITLPAQQTYREESFAEGANPMVALSDTPVLPFKNLCSIIKIPIIGEQTVSHIVLRTNDPEVKLTGSASVDASDANNPVVSMSEGACDSLILNTDGVQLDPVTPTVFFLVVPAQSYTGGFTVRIYAGEDYMDKDFNAELTAQRSRIYNVGEVSFEPEQQDPPVGDGLALKNAAGLRAFLADPSADKVYLTADINLAGESVTAGSFSGSFDGRGHKISNPGAPLFGSNTGTIKDLTVEGSLTPNTASLNQGRFSPLVLNNAGTISGVVNKTSVTISLSSTLSSSAILGGIAAMSSGSIEDCTNEGTISLVSSSSVKGIAIGGIAGYQTGTVRGCTNSAALTFSASHPRGTSAIGSISGALVSMGGITGYGYTGFAITGSINNGPVSFDFTSIESINADSERHQIGGIVGSPCGPVSNCTNNGSIHVGAVTTSRSSYATHCLILNVGGIAGGDFYAPGQNVSNILDCTNSGAIDIDFDASDANTTVGGIVGWPNKEANVSNRTEGCSNSGAITVHGSGKGRFGGIQAGTGYLVNCHNSGDIIIESTATSSSAGGVCAFHAYSPISGCSNTGNIRSKVNLTAGQGGLIGSISNQNLTIGEDCSVDCTLESVAPSNSTIGMVVGYFMGTSGKITIGSAGSPIAVAGAVSLSGVSAPITSSNYQDWLAGTANSNSNHVIYAVCDSQGSDVTQVTGHVLYEDGSPAIGVSVSNGFDMVITDASGSYTLPDNDDVRYYYISLPSDAVIQKNADGCPDFYKKRIKGSPVYDFTLKRQAVEDKFLLYALADPQAYHIKTGSQSKSETDRFRDESVPAVNANIASASLPCYVVTLGDIIYNEGNRDSNGGLTIMRSHCADINAPVFQTFGNHDYTFFSSSKPLTTDSGSSTLYLKAQRAFEECFGPIDYSFNRGDVHVVCMRNVIWTSNTTNSKYHGGLTDSQLSWLQADLANVPSSKTVVLCVHIPMESCLERSSNNAAEVIQLLKGFARAEIFSGHTHLMINIPDLNGTGIYEHVHTSVCGMFWNCNLAVDGCPNGYSVYEFNGGNIVDSYFTGINTGMNTREYQMRIYRGGLKYGGKYIYFQSPHSSDKLFINVFNADSNWKVEVYENGVKAGEAQLMPEKMETHTEPKYSTVVFGENSSQDWWAAAYPVGVLGQGFDGDNLKAYGDFQDSCYHMYKYTMKNPSATVKVVATDSFGNRYECTDVISEDCWYPEYMRYGNI